MKISHLLVAASAVAFAAPVFAADTTTHATTEKHATEKHTGKHTAKKHDAAKDVNHNKKKDELKSHGDEAPATAGDAPMEAPASDATATH